MRYIIALTLASFCRAASAEPLVLFADDGLPAVTLHDPITGAWRAPAGNWARYLRWVASGAKPGGPPVAFLDSGVMTQHPLIKPVLKQAFDLTGEGPEDEVGHGTTVELIFLIAGAQPDGDTAMVNPLVSIKVVGKKPSQDGLKLVFDGLKIAKREGSRIVNVSAGVFTGCVNARNPNGSSYLLQCEDTDLCKFIADESAKTDGLLVVAAVGNKPGETACPACCKSALAVGAADENGKPASYSGAFPDVLAPGNVKIGPLMKDNQHQ